MIDPAISQKLQAKLSEELEDGERVLWSAMPKPKYFTNQAQRECWIGAMFLAMIVTELAWNAGFLLENEVPLLVIAGCFLLAVIGVSVWLLIAPLRNYWSNLKTLYVITDQRAIILEDNFDETVRSFYPKHLWNVFRREHQDGTGDLVIFTEVRGDEDSVIEDMGFFRIPHAKQIEKVLRSMAKGIAVRCVADVDAPISHSEVCGIDLRIPAHLQNTIIDELESGELVRWSSVPVPMSSREIAGYRWAAGIWIAICSAVAVGLIVRYGEEFYYSRSMLTLIPLGFVSVMFAAAILASQRAFYRRLSNIAYVITDRRAIIVHGKDNITIHSLSPFKLRNRSRRNHRNGTSDILIKHNVWRWIEKDAQYVELGLYRIEDADHVEELLESLGKSNDVRQTMQPAGSVQGGES